jgi:uncharacterized protein (TIGR03437 family)
MAEGEIVNKETRGSPFIYFPVLLFGIIAHAQSVPSLQPPAQTHIYDFNGSVFAPVPAVPALNLTASFSIEFWMMINYDMVDSQYMRVFQKGIPNSGDPYTGYELDLEPGTHQLAYSQSTGNPGTFRSAQIGVSLVLGQWYHVAIVSDNLQVTLYLNGQQQASFTAAGPPPINSFPLVLNGQAYGDGTMFCCGFPGSLRQFRIWGRALQPTEITSLATELLSGSEAGLIADWPLDDGQGQTLHDLGPNQLTLSFVAGYLKSTDLYPDWQRTEVVDGGAYFNIQTLTIPQTANETPTLLIPIDFDSDGTVDLLACGHPVHTTAKWPCAAFHNDGKGNFTDVTLQVLGANPPAFEAPGDFCVADFNGDGRADVFIANTVDCCGFPGGQNALLLQTAEGRLEDVTATNLPQQLTDTQRVACGDIDGDGDVDVYLANFIAASGPPPQIYLNDGQGHFTVGDSSRLPAMLQATNPWQFVNASARFIDVNNDGLLDLFLGAADTWDNQPHDLLLLNDGNGFFTLAPDNALPTRYGGRDWGTVGIQVVDFDGDGWSDLINTVNAPNYSEGAIQILLNNHDGTFRDATDLILQPAWQRNGSLYSDPGGVVYVDPVFPADFNGDGFIDLLVEGVNQPARLFLNTGPAGGGRLVEVTELLPDSADYFAVADLNGDGAPDIVAWNLDCCNPSNPTLLESWLSGGRKFTFAPDLIPPVPTGPFFLRGSVLNSASNSADALVPGELVTIYGSNLGPDTLTVASSASGAFPVELSATRVLFNGVAAPIIYTSGGVVSAVVPFSVAPQSRAKVVLEYQGNQSPPVSIFVASSAPGLFTSDSSGAGPAAVLNVDSVTGAVSVNSPQNPAPPGGIIVAYITGAGRTNPPSTDGAVATSAGALALPIEAGLGFFPSSGMGSTLCESAPNCTPVQVLYAGPAPGIVAGVTQVNMRLPDSPSASGTNTLGISVGGIWSQFSATVSVR